MDINRENSKKNPILSIVDPRILNNDSLDDEESDYEGPAVKRFKSGNFAYIRDANRRQLMISLWKYIVEKDLTNEIVNINKQSEPRCLVKKQLILKELNYLGFDIAEKTLDSVLRDIEYIVENGEEEYMLRVYWRRNA